MDRVEQLAMSYEKMDKGLGEERVWRLISSEAMAIIAIMRQNARFRVGSVRDEDDASEHSLIQGLQRVRRHHFVSRPPGRKAIEPFVELITSAETPAFITGAALLAVGRLLREGAVVRAADLGYVVEGVLACRFEQSDAASDEKVIALMFRVLEAAVDSPLLARLWRRPQLPVRVVVEVVLSVRKAVKEGRFSPLLRDAAARTLCAISERLCCILCTWEEDAEKEDEEDEEEGGRWGVGDLVEVALARRCAGCWGRWPRC